MAHRRWVNLRGLDQLAQSALWGLVLVGCSATVDPLGKLPEAGPAATQGFDSDSLLPVSGPASYPNAFGELLGKSDAEIAAKLDAALEQLFHGDPASQAIYFEVGDDQAYIQDIFHGDTRSEGMSLGMLIAVELDRRDEFDRLWRFAAASLRYVDGPNVGYFRSTCADGPCADPYGQQMLVTALLLAHGRWGSHGADIDYGAEALAVLHAMRGRSAGTDMFEPTTALVVDEPSGARALRTRPSNVMPAAYELWARATGDASWSDAAAAGRKFLEATAHPATGLVPLRASFDGSALAGSDAFLPEGYRALFNIALDHVWFEPSAWYPRECDRVLGFFASQGIETYGSSYPLDGSKCLECGHTLALVSMNGTAALPATRPDRADFVAAVWNAETPDGQFRYYDGLLHLLAMVLLSGELRIH